MHLTGLLIAGLADKPQVKVVSPVGTTEGRSQIVVVTLGSADENAKLCERLAEGGVVGGQAIPGTAWLQGMSLTDCSCL